MMPLKSRWFNLISLVNWTCFLKFSGFIFFTTRKMTQLTHIFKVARKLPFFVVSHTTSSFYRNTMQHRTFPVYGLQASSIKLCTNSEVLGDLHCLYIYIYIFANMLCSENLFFLWLFILQALSNFTPAKQNRLIWNKFKPLRLLIWVVIGAFFV